ncbi:carbamoyl-phosphate synthase (glutamine-hydrolyzing) large subunit [Candidatus Roizmanbacteria bacterium]|nr:carbamoyl-phosphate synthase (glutamine-hydrolyzing) large subunit [Candidatus Roizmanbacteria bacterium]
MTPLLKLPKKILVLGSGALKIGEAGEFDYSGSQAIKAFKEEGIKTVLINPNIATIQTSESLADKVYFLPVEVEFVGQVLEKERPDAIAVSFGGQTALNCAIKLYEKGILKKYGVRVLGTPMDSVILTEDRDMFSKHLSSIGAPAPASRAAESVEAAVAFAKEIGYPVMIRAAFALGGQKSGVAYNEEELKETAKNALVFSSQVLIDKYLHHYKELEYEIVRDAEDNCVTVCNMENMDPLGIHTGESIVVAPSQTLNNFEYHTLRSAAISIIKTLNIIGECNIQFGLNPHPKKGRIEYYVIEVNARLSRSSALASKATGYPLAYVAAKIQLGYRLSEIKNQVTSVTQSFFEPALDYVVVKIPRWDLEKFKNVKSSLGSSMKSVGEVMSIGRTFEEALQKAIRMLDIGYQGVLDKKFPDDKCDIIKEAKTPTPKRIFALAEALKRGITVEKLSKETGIDPWFLSRIKNIVDTQVSFQKEPKLNRETILHLKQLGFSDRKIGLLCGKTELEMRQERKKLEVIPAVLQIDTLAGEVPAKTNYLYLTYNATYHDIEPFHKEGIIVLGSGPYRIGSSVEFDWTNVHTVLALKQHHHSSIVINCNPETVSTDYDISDRLYFDEISFERVADVYEFEQSQGMIISVGGQRPNNNAKKFAAYNIPIIGTQADDIDRAEDRNKFSDLLDSLHVPQPEWNKFVTVEEAKSFSNRVGYPVLIRPSYVLSGSAMNVCYNESDLLEFIEMATDVSKEHPITVSKFIEDAQEIEFDGIAQNGELKVYAVSEHVENAGVHSGDATIVFPPQRIYLQTEQKIVSIAKQLVAALKVTGPCNIQFISKNRKVYVIEMNVRASRTLPFISKATGINFADILVDALFGKAKRIEVEYKDYVVVKAPQFSFARLEGADPVLRVEMSSTGEAAAFGEDVEEALLKAELSVGATRPKKGIFVSIGGDENKVKLLSTLLRIHKLGLPIYATEKTHKFMKANGIPSKRLYKIHEQMSPTVLDCFKQGKIDLAINVTDYRERDGLQGYYVIRRSAIDNNIHLIMDREKAFLFVKALTEKKDKDLLVKAWGEYR